MTHSSKLPHARFLLLLAISFAITFAYAMVVPHLSFAQSPTADPQDDPRPLSPAQIALFETPHLQNIPGPETIRYTYRRLGPAGFTDTVALHVQQINSDGTKNLTFDYLSGPNRVLFPALDHFRGNPLTMLVLDRDVAAMKDAIGISASFFRSRIRESFVDAATVEESSTSVGGETEPARIVTVQPFAHEARLERIASLQAKSYRFVLAEAVPGGIAEIRIDTPADPALQAPAMSEQITFAGVDP